jgi:hypothetical protein
MFVKRAPVAEQETVKFANGTPVHVNNIVPDYRVRECLSHLSIVYKTENYNMLGFVLECDDINFKCMSPNAKHPTQNQIQSCLKNMQKGKCPYKIARQIFTNIPNKKSR